MHHINLMQLSIWGQIMQVSSILLFILHLWNCILLCDWGNLRQESFIWVNSMRRPYWYTHSHQWLHHFHHTHQTLCKRLWHYGCILWTSINKLNLHYAFSIHEHVWKQLSVFHTEGVSSLCFTFLTFMTTINLDLTKSIRDSYQYS